MRRRARAVRLFLVAVLAWWVGGIAGALAATAPAPAVIAPRTEIEGVRVEDVAVEIAGTTARGWFAGAGRGRCVVLAAGVRGNRTRMVPRAAWWLAQGFAVLLVDLRGTGASEPMPISFGWHEAEDLVAWHVWLRGRGMRAIGVHAQSLGAAAACYAADRVTWDFAVLEAPYDDIRNALAARMPWVPLPDLALWPMVAVAEWRLGVDVSDLRPVRHATALRGPCLLLAGTEDRTPTRAQTEAVFAAIGSERKLLRWIDGAGHADLWSHDRARCIAAIRELGVVE